MASDWRFVVSGTATDPETNYGFVIQQYNGAGMPPIDNIVTDYGFVDGGIFQRQRAGTRTMTLTGIINGSSVSDLHTKRKSLINAVKPDRSASQQAMVIQYVGGASTLQASAFYDDGLSFGNVDVFREQIGMRFLMLDPYWEKTSSTSATLTVQTTVACANFVLQRAASGTWYALGQGLNSIPYSIAAASDGTLIFGGIFTTASGVTASRVAQYNNGWRSVGTGMDNDVNAVTIGRDGYIYATGLFNTASAAAASRVARFNGTSWQAMQSGLFGTGNQGFDLATDRDGNIIVVGNFTSAGSGASAVSACGIVKWNVSTSSWNIVGSGLRERTVSTNAIVQDVAVAANGDIWAVGSFDAAGTSSMTACNIARYGYSSSSWSTIAGSGTNFLLYSIDFSNDGTAWIGGSTSVYTSNGTAIYTTASTDATVNSVNNISYSNQVWVGGDFSTVNGVSACRSVRFIGNTPTLIDVLLPGTNPTVYSVHSASDSVLTIGFGGGIIPPTMTASAAAVTIVTNNGTSNTYPILTASAPTSTSAQLWQLVNYTTGEGIYFNLPLSAGEIITLDLRVGKKTLTSNIRGNILNTIVPGSNLTTWHLTPGNNNVSFFMSSGSGAAKLTWTERFWSIDN